MKYQFHILLVCAFSIFIFGLSDVYASGQLSFEQNRMVSGHSAVIWCNGCSEENGSMTVTLTGPSSNYPVDVELKSVIDDDFSSEFVKLCSSPCGINDFNYLIL